jgi:tripartite-type tricarboxylate transporter receptor subunit TctC
MDEAGIRDYEFSTWYGLLVPAGTPKSIVERLNQETRNAVESTVLKEQFARQGLEAAASGANEFGRFLNNEVAKWAKVIKASGATAQ